MDLRILLGIAGLVVILLVVVTVSVIRLPSLTLLNSRPASAAASFCALSCTAEWVRTGSSDIDAQVSASESAANGRLWL